jgi:hypothetical protein
VTRAAPELDEPPFFESTPREVIRMVLSNPRNPCLILGLLLTASFAFSARSEPAEPVATVWSVGAKQSFEVSVTDPADSAELRRGV